MKGILLDTDGDLLLRPYKGKTNEQTVNINGLVIGDVELDIVERIIRVWQGEFKEAPLLGGNIDKYQKGIHDPFLRGHIEEQLIAEKIRLLSVGITEDGIEVELKNRNNY